MPISYQFPPLNINIIVISGAALDEHEENESNDECDGISEEESEYG